MGIWIALGAAALAVAVAVILLRRRGKQPADSDFYVTTEKLRVSWPPGYPDTRPIRTVHKPDALYLIEAFDTRSAALNFLRGCEVRDERIYLIAENPEGNLGKDLIMIFEEADGSLVEISERSPLPALQLSNEDCARCGYSVIPAPAPGTAGIVQSDGTVRWSVALTQMEVRGAGFHAPAVALWPAQGATDRCHRRH